MSVMVEKKIVFCGLDRARKTSIIKTILGGEFVQTMRTIGFTMDQLQINKLKIEVVDLGGQVDFRPGWYLHLGNASLVWVVDSTDKSRFNEMATEFENVRRSLQPNAFILVLANKQDSEEAESIDAIATLLKLDIIPQKWKIFATSAQTTEGLRDAFKWLYESITQEEISLESEYRIPSAHLENGMFNCLYLEAGTCPTPNLVPNSCPSCKYGSCQNCLNQVPECLHLFPDFFQQ